MSSTGRTLASLQNLGFMPNQNSDMFDLYLGEHMTRVMIEDVDVLVYVMTKNEVVIWQAKLSEMTPDSVVDQTIMSAVRDALNR